MTHAMQPGRVNSTGAGPRRRASDKSVFAAMRRGHYNIAPGNLESSPITEMLPEAPAMDGKIALLYSLIPVAGAVLSARFC